MNPAVKEICEKLLAIRELCLTETTDLRTQLAEAEKELEQVDAALTAIGEKPSSSKKKRASGKSRLPCATKDEVLDTIHEVLRENGEVPEDDLKSLAGEKLRKRGKSLSMFGRLFGNCLDDPSLEPVNGNRYALAGQGASDAKTSARKVGF
ncbi:hypothetical protein Pla123a_44540 [Posidoniimonas polymericola]|uniref:Uncharacterized protein n=1 Tax=Posidoniimonas polymericola TaxID=2528002 RepID=A0A5C5XVU3_9BACT|nr:hypothetical protein [Posidoniimonas polymericola]TWT67024.1 hypothetical protein Pla123a_44540 [Posidoniimonas polymericola]